MVDLPEQPINTPRVSTTVEEKAQHVATVAESRQDMHDAIRGSNQVLARARTTLTLFPDTLTVDRAKLTVTKHATYRSAEVTSMRIEDILSVTATVGPIFGSVKIVSRVFNSEEPFVIGLFWRNEAIKIKRITQGYVIALQREIDCTSLPTKELIAMLDKLGEDDHSL